MMKNKAMRCVWLVCGLLMLAGFVAFLELFRAESCDAAFELSSRVPGVFEAAARGCEDAAPVPRAGV